MRAATPDNFSIITATLSFGRRARRSLKAEVELLLGPIHVLLEILFPDLRPRPVEHVRHAESMTWPGATCVANPSIGYNAPRALRPAEPVGRIPPLLIVCVTESAPAAAGASVL